jgi:hypothetical protein
MSKPQKLSAEAAAAKTEGDFWSLFFTQQVPSCCDFFIPVLWIRKIFVRIQILTLLIWILT